MRKTQSPILDAVHDTAKLLNTSVATVQEWKIGQKKPTETALKLMHLCAAPENLRKRTITPESG